MTLIASYINKFGVIVASDSNLTSREGNSGNGQKVFPIPFLNSALAYSGRYDIRGRDLDEWMSDFILNAPNTCDTINEFVQNLTTHLNLDFNGNEDDISIIHICGYSTFEYHSYLEHWHISNTALLNTGSYRTPITEFHYSNDFNSRTEQANRDFLITLDNTSENNQFYINGFPPGRMSYMFLKQNLEEMLHAIRQQPGWHFNSPKNLFETASQLKMYFHLISEMFKMSDYNALYVGGDIQTFLIPAPLNLNKTPLI